MNKPMPMNAQDYFDDCTADLGNAVIRFRFELHFEGDSPSKRKTVLIRRAWDNLKSKYDRWLKSLSEAVQ